MKYFNSILLVLVISATGYTATYTTASVGDWDNLNTWLVGGLTPSSLPGTGDDVNLNHDVTIKNTQASHSYCQTINVSAGATLFLDATETKKLQIIGSSSNLTCTIDGTISNGKIHFSRNRTLVGSGSIDNVYLLINNYTLYSNINITVYRIKMTVGASFHIESGATLTVNGLVTKSLSGGKIINNGTIDLNTNLFLTTNQPASSVFQSTNGNLIFSDPTATFPVPQDGGYKDVTINVPSLTVDADFTVSGDWTNTNTFNSSPGNTITFNGASQQSISGSSGVNNFNNIILNNSSGLLLNSGTINIEEFMESISGKITLNDTLNLKSSSENSAGILKVSSSSDFENSSGHFTVERYLNPSSAGWRMFGAPIKNADFSDWDDELIYCGITTGTGNYSYAYCGNFYSVYSFDEIGDTLAEVTSMFSSISNANGYIVYTSSGATTLSVSGDPEFDSFLKPITKDNDGWNLISNPYPATLDWTNGSNTGFHDVNSLKIDDAFYIYEADFNSGAGRYKTITSGAQDIPHSQGFWVKKTDPGDDNLTFNINQTIGSQPSFIKSNNGVNNPLIIKSIYDSTGYFDDAEIKSAFNYSSGYDIGKEITKLFSPYPDYVSNIYFIDNSLNELHKICINNNTSDSLFFDVRIGSYASGNYTLEFENLNQFMIGSCLKLEDLNNGIITDLRRDSVYNFTSDSTAPTPRFKLYIDIDYNINVDNLTCFQDSSGSVKIEGQGISGSYFRLIDSLDHTIDSLISSQDSLTFSNLNSGVYSLSTNHTGSCSISNQEIIISEPENINANFISLNIFGDTLFLDSNRTASISFLNNSFGANNYIWDFGDLSISNEFSPNHIYDSAGTYNITLTASNDSTFNCLNKFTSTLHVIDTNSSISNIINFNEYGKNIFFNNNFIFLNFDKKLFNELNIYDLNGKLILSSNYQNIINVSSIPAGFYVIHLIGENKNYNQKIFIPSEK